MCSSTWSAMLKCKEKMMKGCCWAVGNGEQVDIWNDPWIPNLQSKSPEFTSNSNTLFRKVMHDNPRRWNGEKLAQLFNPTEMTNIKSIYIQNNEENNIDTLLWTDHPNGVFSSKSFLKYLQVSRPSMSTGADNNLPWKKFWRIKTIPPRVQMFIWRLVRNRLLALINMDKILHNINVDCRFCNQDVDSVDHLFIQFPFSQVVLLTSPLLWRVEAGGITIIKEVIAEWVLEKDHDKFKMGACIFWAIWKSRNQAIFNKLKPNIHSIISETSYRFVQDQNPGDMLNTPIESDMLNCTSFCWLPLNGSIIKINFDGAAGPRRFACVAVIRDYSSSFQGGQAKVLGFISPLKAETNGALLGVELALPRRFNQLEGDALVTINMLKFSRFEFQ
ncbi:uncharacterized protein LOC113273307 [Papaver somniferum]|uniref:uncharacterized protein LOC113273307 n=1 Tax=Papaver somniferum TaxID=3469 RepID=UPI000E6F8BC0|nr:uncharacterized protein LOC113273307 [Papaver somniferum]